MSVEKYVKIIKTREKIVKKVMNSFLAGWYFFPNLFFNFLALKSIKVLIFLTNYSLIDQISTL